MEKEYEKIINEFKEIEKNEIQMVAETIRKIAREEIKNGINLNRAFILIALRRENQSITTISERAGISYRNTLRSIAFLKKNKYIKTKKDPLKNKTICSISQKGNNMIDRFV
jgi:DNA-binding MarR family transcriptional regulator